jgi:hypothetical protein
MDSQSLGLRSSETTTNRPRELSADGRELFVGVFAEPSTSAAPLSQTYTEEIAPASQEVIALHAQLVACGFSDDQAAHALEATGDPEAALNSMLLENEPTVAPTAPTAPTAPRNVNRGGWMSSMGTWMSSAASAAGQAISSAKSKFKWKGAAMDM